MGGGAGYVEASERGSGLYGDMVKLLCIIELAAWRWTYQAALLTTENVHKIGIRTNGFSGFEAPVFRLAPGQRIEDRLYWLATRHREAVVADLLRPETAAPSLSLNWPSEHDIAEARRAVWGGEHSDLLS